MAIISFFISWDQINYPNLSVAIFAQNGVYAYFSAAFVPVLFGTFLKDVSVRTVFIASIVAIVTHFSIYYFKITPYMKVPVQNPGISASIGIVASVIIGYFLYKFGQNKKIN